MNPRRALLVFAITGALLALVATAASAHGTELVSMTPADGATVDPPLRRVVVRWNRPVTVEQLSVAGPAGDVPARVVQRDVETVLRMTAAAPGTYRLSWVVPQADGHEVRYRRSVEVRAADPVAMPAEDDDDTSTMTTAEEYLHDFHHAAVHAWELVTTFGR